MKHIIIASNNKHKLKEINTILDNYKFYGWSLDKLASIVDISSVFTNDKVVTIYDETYAEKSYSTIYSELTSLVSNHQTGAIKLYSVWETKYQVEFTHNTNVVSNGMYGRGETITAPSIHPGTLRVRVG